MRALLIVLVHFPLTLPGAGLAQGSLCNPCVDPPTRAYPRDFSSPNSVPILRPENIMRRLGIPSADDRLDRLLETSSIGDPAAERHQLDIARIRREATGRCPRTTATAATELRPAGPGSVWYGTAELAVRLPADGEASGEQVLEWRAGEEAGTPAGEGFELSLRRVDAGSLAASVVAAEFRPVITEARWLTTLEFEEAGCWLVTGSLGPGRQTSIVIESTGG